MSIVEAIVQLFAPHTCVACGTEEDRLLCEACRVSLAVAPSRCYQCYTATDAYAVCRDCASNSSLSKVLVGVDYQDAAKELVQRMKYGRAKAGAHEMATILAPLLAQVSGEDMVLTHVPTANTRVRQRGYDQAQVLTRHLARKANLRYTPLLARIGDAHQVGAGRATRLRQMQGAFQELHTGRIREKHVVLVDDVLTTGATLEMAAHVLRRAGATRVSAIVFAQAQKPS